MRKHLFPVLLLANTLWSCLFAQTPIVMDMVHHNPGEPSQTHGSMNLGI